MVRNPYFYVAVIDFSSVRGVGGATKKAPITDELILSPGGVKVLNSSTF